MLCRRYSRPSSGQTGRTRRGSGRVLLSLLAKSTSSASFSFFLKSGQSRSLLASRSRCLGRKRVGIGPELMSICEAQGVEARSSPFWSREEVDGVLNDRDEAELRVQRDRHGFGPEHRARGAVQCLQLIVLRASQRVDGMVRQRKHAAASCAPEFPPIADPISAELVAIEEEQAVLLRDQLPHILDRAEGGGNLARPEQLAILR